MIKKYVEYISDFNITQPVFELPTVQLKIDTIQNVIKKIEILVPNLQILIGKDAWNHKYSNDFNLDFCQAVFVSKKRTKEFNNKNIDKNLICLHKELGFRELFHELAHALGTEENLNRKSMIELENASLLTIEEMFYIYSPVEEIIADEVANQLLIHYELHTNKTIECCKNYKMRMNSMLSIRGIPSGIDIDYEVARCVKAIVKIVDMPLFIKKAA